MGNISLRKLEAAEGTGGRTRHGIQAYLSTGKLPSGRAWKREEAKVAALRRALVEQYGGEAGIRPDVLSLIESAVEGLMIQRLATLYVKKAGIMRRDSLKNGDLCLHSILSGQFISYANLVRLNLEAAARLAAQANPESSLTPLEVAAEIDREKAEKASGGQDSPGMPGNIALAGQTPSGEGGGQGKAT